MIKIDAHNHPDFHGWNFDRQIKNMDEAGISQTWLLSWETPEGEYAPETEFCMSLPVTGTGPNPFSLCWEYKQKAPDRFILGYGPDPRTPEEVRAHRELVRRREYAKYAARTRLGMFWNKLQYRRWRALSKALQRKGIIPPNEPGASR